MGLSLNHAKIALLAALLVIGSQTPACTSGTVHTVLEDPQEKPRAPRPADGTPPSDHVEDSENPGITPADSAAGLPNVSPEAGDASLPSLPGSPNAPSTDPEAPTEPGTPSQPGTTTEPGTPSVPGTPTDSNATTPPVPNPETPQRPTPPPAPPTPDSPNDAAGPTPPGLPSDSDGTPGGTRTEPNGATTDPNSTTGGLPGNANSVSGDPNGASGGTPANPNGARLPPDAPLTPREACHQAWLAQGHQARYGDPFAMPAAEDPEWSHAFRIGAMDVEARPAQYLQISTSATAEQGNTCAVPTAWNVEIITADINFDTFLASYQRVEPIRRQLATAGIAMEEKSFTAWQDFSDRVFWLTWTLRPYAPSLNQLQTVVHTLQAPVEQPATWYTAVDTVENVLTPGLAVGMGRDADPANAPYWGVLSDAVRASADEDEAHQAFLAVAPAATSSSFYRAINVANVWTWDRLASFDAATGQAMACNVDADTFEGRCDQRLPAYASQLYRDTLEQNAPLFVHLLWETRAKQEAFLTTVRVNPDGSVAVEKTQRYGAGIGQALPGLAALHALENF